MYNSSTLSGGGPGGSDSGENGYNGTLSGAGGGGGTVRFQTSGSNTTAYRGAGGKGANGMVEITYDLMYRAAGGGGGGGGAEGPFLGGVGAAEAACGTRAPQLPQK